MPPFRIIEVFIFMISFFHEYSYVFKHTGKSEIPKEPDDQHFWKTANSNFQRYLIGKSKDTREHQFFINKIWQMYENCGCLPQVHQQELNSRVRSCNRLPFLQNLELRTCKDRPRRSRSHLVIAHRPLPQRRHIIIICSSCADCSAAHPCFVLVVFGSASPPPIRPYNPTPAPTRGGCQEPILIQGRSWQKKHVQKIKKWL